jgi:RimJ/RimL family protein N-acetyltransferase
VPLKRDHLEPLYEISKDPSIWKYNPNFLCDSKESFTLYIEKSLAHMAERSRICLVAIKRDTGEYVGSSSIYGISEEHRRLIIGIFFI